MRTPDPAPQQPKRQIGYPRGAFTRTGKWIPDGWHGKAVDEAITAMLYVRRHESLSPAEYLERLSRYEHATIASGLLGPAVLGAMSNRSVAEDWSVLAADVDLMATDAACWIIHCGAPYAGHRWRDSGHWVPVDGPAVWESQARQEALGAW